MVKDIGLGADSSNPTGLTAVGGRLFFSAATLSYGQELWISTGSASGTRLVKDISPGRGGSNPTFLIDGGGQLLFASNGGGGDEVRKSDGTRAGTLPVGDLIQESR